MATKSTPKQPAPTPEPAPATPAKPGWQTTEFALTALLVVAVTVLLAIGRISVEDIVDLWPLAAGISGYALSRGITKGMSA